MAEKTALDEIVIMYPEGETVDKFLEELSEGDVESGLIFADWLEGLDGGCSPPYEKLALILRRGLQPDKVREAFFSLNKARLRESPDGFGPSPTTTLRSARTIVCRKALQEAFPWFFADKLSKVFRFAHHYSKNVSSLLHALAGQHGLDVATEGFTVPEHLRAVALRCAVRDDGPPGSYSGKV